MPIPLFAQAKKTLTLALLFSLITVFSLPSPVQAASYSAERQTLQNTGFETDEYWLPYQNGFSYDTRVRNSGSRSLKLRNNSASARSGAYQRVDLNQTEILPVTLSGYVRGQRIRNSSDGYFGASLYAEIHLTTGDWVYWNSVGYFGTFDWQHVALSIGNLPQVTAPIDYLYVVPILADASGTAWFDDLALTEYRGTQAAVTFMFDDGEESHYNQAKPILDSHNFKATAFVPTDNIGLPGYFTQDQIKELYQSGWEIAAHGQTHQDFTQMSNAKLTRELYYPIRIFSRMGIPVTNVAYPYGAYNGNIVQQVSRYYRSGRAYEIGTTQSGTWLFDTKLRSLESTTTLADLQSWVTDAQSHNKWLILSGHRIAESGDDQYYMTPAQLQQVVDYIASTGAPVVTYNQGLDLFAL